MWIEVKYKEELIKGCKVRVKRTGHEAFISEVIIPETKHCKCYHIEPRDNKSLEDWYFSHDFEKQL